MSNPTTHKNRIHLVGSLNTATAEESFTLASTLIEGELPRVPDGEVGERYYWLNFQGDRLAAVPGLSRIDVAPIPFGGFDARPVHLDGTVALDDIEITDLGYATAAIDSYRVFQQFKAEGKFARETRFQVSLPTPLAVVSSYVVAGEQQSLLPKYEAALLREIDEILAVIPTTELAIQFDVAVEFIYIERINIAKYEGDVEVPWFGDRFTSAAALLADLINRVPSGIEVGVHLCYGDIGEQHFFQPLDTANLVTFANALVPFLTRDLDFLHLPVPIERDDDAYYAPLGTLSLVHNTELFLGLIHREDGEAGIARRAATASRYVSQFGIATECGFGRGPIEAREDLFRLHA